MNNHVMLTNQEAGFQLNTFNWRGRVAWMAQEIARLSEHASGKVAIYQFLNNHDCLEIGEDYDTLVGDDLKEFKLLVADSGIDLAKVKHITIFYESALWAFLQSLRTELGKNLRRWINREVLPQIREQGFYIPQAYKEQLEQEIRFKLHRENMKFIAGIHEKYEEIIKEKEKENEKLFFEKTTYQHMYVEMDKKFYAAINPRYARKLEEEKWRKMGLEMPKRERRIE